MSAMLVGAGRRGNRGRMVGDIPSSRTGSAQAYQVAAQRDVSDLNWPKLRQASALRTSHEGSPTRSRAAQTPRPFARTTTRAPPRRVASSRSLTLSHRRNCTSLDEGYARSCRLRVIATGPASRRAFQRRRRTRAQADEHPRDGSRGRVVETGNIATDQSLLLMSKARVTEPRSGLLPLPRSAREVPVGDCLGFLHWIAPAADSGARKGDSRRSGSPQRATYDVRGRG